VSPSTDRPDRAFILPLFRRAIGVGVFGVLGIGLLAALIATIVAIPSRKTSMSAAEAIGAILLLAIPAALFLICAWASTRAGRVEFRADRALLPRLPFPPTCFLRPRELVYARVRRFGVGVATIDVFTRVTQLVFEVEQDNGGVTRMVCGLSLYDNPAEVFDEFKQRIGQEPLAMKEGLITGLRFETKNP
jgi:hypothetical protein